MNLPHHLAAEAGILGGLLYNNELFERVSDTVREEDFYAPAHRAAFALIRDMIQSGRVADGVTLSEAAGAADRLSEIGGTKYLFDLLDAAALPPEIWDYCTIIADMARRRELIQAGQALAASANTLAADEALEAHEAALEIVRERQAGHVPVAACADNIEQLFATSAMDGLVPSGFPSLDAEIRGFERGALSIIAARPGVGKTAFAVCAAAAMARSESVGFLSLDMQGRVVQQRLAVFLHWSQPRHRRSPRVADIKEPGSLTPETREELAEVLRSETGRRILINDRGGQTTRTVAQQIRAWHRYCHKRSLPPLGAVFIDHIAKVAPVQRANSLYEKTSFAANELLDIAKRNPRTAIIALAQLSRDNEKTGRRPMISDLRDSGKVEEDASLVLLLHREDMKWSMIARNSANSPEDIQQAKQELMRCQNNLEVIIGKNRNGDMGAVTLWHNMAWNAVRDLSATKMEMDLNG
jgi:replicative DNA helicase